MTEAEWKKEKSRLKGAITRAKTTVLKCPSLAEKIEAKRGVKRAEEALDQHKLNYYNLVDERYEPRSAQPEGSAW